MTSATGWKSAVTRTVSAPTGGHAGDYGSLTNGVIYAVAGAGLQHAEGSGAWVRNSLVTPTATPAPRLTGLSLAAGSETAVALTPSFSGTRAAYTATVGPGTTSVAVTPTWTATGTVSQVTAASYRFEDDSCKVNRRFCQPCRSPPPATSAIVGLAVQRRMTSRVGKHGCGTGCTTSTLYTITVSQAGARPRCRGTWR